MNKFHRDSISNPIFNLSSLLLLMIFVNYWSLAQMNIKSGTTIVVLKTADEIIIGADSRNTITDFRTKNKSIFQTCKIHQLSDDFVYTAAHTTHLNGIFDIDSSAHKAFKGDLPIRDKLIAFIKDVQKTLIPALQATRQLNPDYFKDHYANKTILNSILAFKIGAELHLMVLTFKCTIIEGGLIEIPVPDIYECPGNCERGQPILYFGEVDSIQNFTSQYKKTVSENIGDYFKTFGIVEGIRNFIRLECKAQPDKVGEPIDIISLGVDGVFWHTPKRDCSKGSFR